MTTSELTREAVAYYDLCQTARRLGVPVSLDDSRSPKTIEGLRRAVENAKA